jgi:hypothetical protein
MVLSTQKSQNRESQEINSIKFFVGLYKKKKQKQMEKSTLMSNLKEMPVTRMIPHLEKNEARRILFNYNIIIV